MLRNSNGVFFEIMSVEMVPEDFASLKRPALQKLCKKFGIKANGKNVDMIKALEELRCSLLQDNSESNVESAIQPELPETLPTKCQDSGQPPSSPPGDVLQEIAPDKGAKKRSSRRKRQTRKKASKSSPEDETLPVNVQPTTSENDSTHSSTEPVHTSQQDMESSCPPSLTTKEDASSSFMSVGSTSNISNSETQTTIGCKRKRRDTYSVSPKSSSSFDSPMIKHPRLTDYEPSTTASTVESSPNISEQFRSPECPSSSDKENSDTSEMDVEMNSEIPPFSPPPVSGDKSQQRKRKRNSTFVLSTKSPATDGPSSSSTMSASEEATSVDDDGSSEPQTKRLRRETFSVSPKASTPSVGETEGVGSHLELLATTGVSAAAAGDDNGNEGEDMKKAILDMLDKRVEERQADPNYKPVFTGGNNNVNSRIPVKSSTAVKFDKAHKKQFRKMKNIASDQKEKEKRARSLSKHTPNCAKRAKSMVGEKPRVQKLVKPSNIPKPVGKKTTVTSSSVFRPSVLSTKQAFFTFNKPPSVNNTTPKAANTSTVSKKTPGKIPSDIGTSLKRKPSYKPYSGKLPSLSKQWK